MAIRLKRIYDPPRSDDGLRILVDRLWPRGISKQSATVGRWVREIAPSDSLRKWYGHELQRWTEFRRRYRQELNDQRALIRELRKLSRERRITLLFSARDREHNNAVVLRELLSATRRVSTKKRRKGHARRPTTPR
jgi:uncharacterized protein YeaO (DUF488 family)